MGRPVGDRGANGETPLPDPVSKTGLILSGTLRNFEEESDDSRRIKQGCF